MYLRCNSICHSQERKEQTYIMYIVVSSRTLIVPCQSPWLFHSPKSPDLLQLIMVMEFVHNLFWTWLYPRQDYDAHSEDGFASQYNPDSQLLCHGKFQAKQCAHSCFSLRVVIHTPGDTIRGFHRVFLAQLETSSAHGGMPGYCLVLVDQHMALLLAAVWVTETTTDSMTYTINLMVHMKCVATTREKTVPTSCEEYLTCKFPPSKRGEVQDTADPPG